MNAIPHLPSVSNPLLAAFPAEIASIGFIVVVLVIVGFLYLLLTCYRKVEKGRALVRTQAETERASPSVSAVSGGSKGRCQEA